MKIQYSYLKNFLNTSLSQKKLSDVFTQVGFECEIEGDLIEFDITPNRGDALSLRGLEREFYAYQSKKPSQKIETSSLKPIQDKKIINQIDGSGCGNYYLMMVKGLQKIKNLDFVILQKIEVYLLQNLLNSCNFHQYNHLHLWAQFFLLQTL